MFLRKGFDAFFLENTITHRCPGGP